MYKPSLLPIATLCTLPLALTACPSQSGPNASSATWAKSQTPAEINLGPREAIEGNPLAELIKTTLAESGPEAALATAQANVVLESFPSCKQSGLLAFSIGEEQPRILLSDGNYTTNLSRLDPVCQHLGFEKATRANFVPLSNAKDGEVENSELLPLFAYESVGQTQGGMPAQAPFHAGYCGPNPQGIEFYPYSAFTGLPEGSFSGTNRGKVPQGSEKLPHIALREGRSYGKATFWNGKNQLQQPGFLLVKNTCKASGNSRTICKPLADSTTKLASSNMYEIPLGLLKNGEAYGISNLECGNFNDEVKTQILAAQQGIAEAEFKPAMAAFEASPSCPNIRVLLDLALKYPQQEELKRTAIQSFIEGAYPVQVLEKSLSEVQGWGENCGPGVLDGRKEKPSATKTFTTITRFLNLEEIFKSDEQYRLEFLEEIGMLDHNGLYKLMKGFNPLKGKINTDQNAPYGLFRGSDLQRIATDMLPERFDKMAAPLLAAGAADQDQLKQLSVRLNWWLQAEEKAHKRKDKKAFTYQNKRNLPGGYVPRLHPRGVDMENLYLAVHHKMIDQHLKAITRDSIEKATKLNQNMKKGRAGLYKSTPKSKPADLRFKALAMPKTGWSDKNPLPYMPFNAKLVQSCVDQASSLVDAALASTEENALFALQDVWHMCRFNTQVQNRAGKFVPLVSNDKNYNYDALVGRFKPQLQKQITAQIKIAITPKKEDIFQARELLKRGQKSTAFGQKRGISNWQKTWTKKVNTAERVKKAREEAERKRREAAAKKRKAEEAKALKSSNCYWWEYKASSCGLAFGGMRTCGPGPSASAPKTCRRLAKRTGKCVCGSKD